MGRCGSALPRRWPSHLSPSPITTSSPSSCSATQWLTALCLASLLKLQAPCIPHEICVSSKSFTKVDVHNFGSCVDQWHHHGAGVGRWWPPKQLKALKASWKHHVFAATAWKGSKAFLKDTALRAIFVFTSVFCYHALHHIGDNLEDPYLPYDPNELPLCLGRSAKPIIIYNIHLSYINHITYIV